MEDISLATFEKSVTTKFEFLILQYNYEYIGSESHPFVYYVKYVKNDLMVRIELGYRHNYLSIYIFNKSDKIEATSQNFKHSISILELAKHNKNLNFDKKIEDYMPVKIGLEKSLDVFKTLLLENADEILKDKKWVSLL